MQKRWLSLLLVLCMLFSLMPFGALAVEDEPGAAEDVVYLDDEAIASLQEDDAAAEAEPAEEAPAETEAEPAAEPEAEPLEASSGEAKLLNAAEADPPAVTRAKWLADLVDAYALAGEVADEALPDNYYPDLAEDHEFYRDILVAVHFGLVDVEPGHALEPDAALTRDFAAFSLNQLTGYLTEAESYSFSDAADVAYPDAAQVAVEHGWLALSGGKFLPDQAVTEAEAGVMVQAAKDAYAATQIDDSHENSIVFNPNVKIVPQGTPADEPLLGTVDITNCPITILAGDTVAVYVSDIPSVYHVESVAVNGDITTITGTPVALSDATMSVDLQGSYTVPLEYARPLDGSELYYIMDSGSQTKSRALAKANSTRLRAIKGSKSIDIGGGVKAKVTFTMPAPVIDYNISPINPWVILSDSNVTASVTLSCDFVEGMGLPSQVLLVGYDVPGVGGVGIYAYLNLDGSVTVSVSGGLKMGISYSGGHLSAPMSFNCKSRTLIAEATMDAGFKAELSVTLWGKKILHGDLYARFGGAMNVRAVVRDAGVKPHYCVGTKEWLYADAGYNATVLGKNYSNSMQLLDLSAFYGVKHYEDGYQVPHCTLDDNFDDYITPPGSRNYSNGGWGGWNGVSYGANWEPIEVYKYTTDEEGNATITGFYGNVSALSIPAQIDGHPVTAINEYAFQGLSQITTVTMPDTITQIRFAAFKNCRNLGDVNLPTSLTYLANEAFAFTALTSIEIPRSLEHSDWYGPFYGCENLKTVIFEQGTESVVGCLFSKCPGLEEIVIPNSVTSIGTDAFRACENLRKVVISDSVTTIENGAFRDCPSLVDVTLSKGLIYLESQVFANDPLTSIEIPKSLESTEWDGPFNGCENLKTVTFEAGTERVASSLFARCPGLEEIVLPNTISTIDSDAFRDCTNLKNVQISNTCTKIDENAFRGCTSLVSITLPNSLTEICDGAFFDCRKLAEIQFGTSITSIGSGAFRNCYALTSVEIPDSVTELKDAAFANCSNLSSVKLSKAVVEIGAFAFYDCDKLESIEIPKSLTSTYDAYIYDFEYGYVYGVFHSCDNLKNITFEAGTTCIANGMFRKCYGLESITIPDTVTEIKDAAFVDCPNLAEVKIGNAVTSIGSSAFRNCPALTAIEIPDSVTELKPATFADCSKLSSVKLSKSLSKMGAFAFYNCDALESIEIPKSLTSTYDAYYYEYEYGFVYGVFHSCDNLKNITFEAGTKCIANGMFRRCSGLESITIPDTVTEIKDSAFVDCPNLAEVKIGNAVTSIGGSAFRNCPALTSIVIPDSVTEIKSSAFNNCTGLSSVKLPKNLTVITSNCFDGCKALQKLEVPVGVTQISEYAFRNNEALTEIQWGTSLKTIQKYAFQNTGMESITLPNTVQTLGEGVFYDSDELTEIAIPNSVTSWGTKTFYDCDLLTDVTLGTGLKSIPDSTFEHCDVLETIVVPYQVTSIGANAFKDCVKFKEITIPRATTSINTTAFSYPGRLTIYGVAGTTAETVAGDIGATFVAIDKPMQSIALSESNITVNRGATAKLLPTFTPADFTDEVMWKTSDANVATVDSDGNVRAVNVGTATISLVGGDCKATCRVTVIQPVTGISLNKTSLSLEGGQTFQLKATINPSNAADKTVAWSSSDETIATVSSDGLVTALRKGTATITCAAQDGSGVTRTCAVTVINDLNIVSSVKELQSPHKYANNCNDVWQYTQEGETSLAVTFSEQTSVEDGSDFIYIFDGNGTQIGKYTGSELAGQTVTVPGDTVRIKLVSDGVYAEYGFAVTQVNDVYGEMPLKITQQPQDFTGAVGETATFTVKATGDGLTYQWQYKDPGSSTWLNSSFTTPSMTCKITAARDGRQYRCIVTDENGASITSASAAIRVKPALQITQQPQDFEGAVGETATFTVKATGDGLTYQWQYKDPGSSAWLNSSFKTPSMTCKITAARDGRQYHCIVTDASGNTITSEAAAIIVKAPAIVITQQPQNFEGAVGETATFTVKATGDGLTYQWQYKDPGSSTWLNSSFKTPSMTCKITAERDGRAYRCLVQDASGHKLYSDAATMKVKKVLTITAQPQNFEGPVGSTATISVKATGDGLTYQWQYKDPGGTWANSSFKTATMTCKLTAARDGRQYRCVITDAYDNSVTSRAAVIIVTD